LVGRSFLSVGVAAAALALTSCAGVPSRTAPPPPTAPTADSRDVSLSSAPPTDNHSSELNRKILGQLTPPVDDADLPLGPGDLIQVSVFDVPELSNLKLRVPQSGTVMLPLIGTIPASGLSSTELADGIRARLQEKYMHDPQVTVFVEEHKSQRISVIGAVRTGGVFSLSSRLKLADALAMAGGLTEDAGHLVYLVRRVPSDEGSAQGNAPASPSNTSVTEGTAPTTPRGALKEVVTAIDLESLAAGKKELNLPLEAGDVIEVARAGSYYVGGEVQKPGSFSLKSRTTIDQATAAAGGLKEAADWDDLRLYRAGADGKRQVFKYSLNVIEKGTPAPEVLKDDVIIVGKSGVKGFLYGVRDFLRFGLGATFPL